MIDTHLHVRGDELVDGAVRRKLLGALDRGEDGGLSGEDEDWVGFVVACAGHVSKGKGEGGVVTRTGMRSWPRKRSDGDRGRCRHGLGRYTDDDREEDAPTADRAGFVQFVYRRQDVRQ